MPAGFYIIHPSALNFTILTIQSKDGMHTAVVDYIPSYADKAHTHSDVTFRKYGSTEFLHRIWVSGQKFGMVILPTNTETRMDDQSKAQEHSVPVNDN